MSSSSFALAVQLKTWTRITCDHLIVEELGGDMLDQYTATYLFLKVLGEPYLAFSSFREQLADEHRRGGGTTPTSGPNSTVSTAGGVKEEAAVMPNFHRFGTLAEQSPATTTAGGSKTVSTIISNDVAVYSWCMEKVMEGICLDLLQQEDTSILEEDDEIEMPADSLDKVIAAALEADVLLKEKKDESDPRQTVDQVRKYFKNLGCNLDTKFWRDIVIPKIITSFRNCVTKLELVRFSKGAAYRISYLAIADWGDWCNELERLADRMAEVGKVYLKYVKSNPSSSSSASTGGAGGTTKEVKLHCCAEEEDDHHDDNEMLKVPNGPGAFDFILSIGDNFYPSGANECDDGEFKMWKKVFITGHSTRLPLRVPWKVALGNHDYGGNYQCQIDYTSHHGNPAGLWHMPDNKYSFSKPIGPNGEEAAFFCFDANVTQFTVRSAHPYKLQEWFQDVAWLKAEVAKYPKAVWKVLYQHHPLYSRGLGHQDEARRLRGKTYRNTNPRSTSIQHDGLDLESVLHSCGIDVVLAGHEHKLQQCIFFEDKEVQQKSLENQLEQRLAGGAGGKKSGNNNGSSKKDIPVVSIPSGSTGGDSGILHAVVGAATESYYWRGVTPDENMDWEASGGRESDWGTTDEEVVDFGDGTGFGAFEIISNAVLPTSSSESNGSSSNLDDDGRKQKESLETKEWETKFILRFISSYDGTLMREVVRTKMF